MEGHVWLLFNPSDHSGINSVHTTKECAIKKKKQIQHRYKRDGIEEPEFKIIPYYVWPDS